MMTGTARVDDTTNRLENLAKSMTKRNTHGSQNVAKRVKDRCRQMNQATATVVVKVPNMIAREVSRDESKKSNSSGAHKEPSKVPSKLVDIGPVQGFPPESLLDREKDYFAYHDHLRLYLYRSEGKYFEDLSSTETHKAFAKFCAKYNRGGLEQGFYQKELPKDAIEQCKRTKHSWNFKTSAAEMKSLDVIKNGVKKQTSYDVKPPSNTVKGPMMCQHASGGLESSNRAVVAPRKVEPEDQKLVSSIVQDKGKLSEQEAVLKSLGLGGLKPGQKIKIAPREM